MALRLIGRILVLNVFWVSFAHGSILFADNFDGNTTQLGTNRTPAIPQGWTVSNGTVDIIGQGDRRFDFLGNGRYIDLDGSSGRPGILSTGLSLTAGTQYMASFFLAGSQRNVTSPNSSETVTVQFGDVSQAWSLPAIQGFTEFLLSFTPANSGRYTLSFFNTEAGAANVGALLDNVVVSYRSSSAVSAVPVPSAAWLLGSSLLAMLLLNRKSTQV